jgi:Glycosyl hydrolase catalytic core
MKKLSLVAGLLLLAFALGCGGGTIGPPPAPDILLALSASSLKVFQGEAAGSVSATVTRQHTSAAATLTVIGLPSGASVQITSPGAGDTGSLMIDPGTAAAGTYALTVTATAGNLRDTEALSLVIGAVVQVMATSPQHFDLAMSTSFQPAEWDYHFFTNWPSASTALGNLLPQHVRLQPISQGVPQRTATTWDFSVVDGITQPVLGVGDHSPEYQIAKGPPFMYTSSNSGNPFQDLTFSQFAGYAQNLVRYYNTGGFTASDGAHVSPSPHPITWWGIYNEPNINNGLTPQQYVDLYNATVPAMQSVDPTLKFVGLELADFGSEPHNWVPTFVNGVTAHVDVVATHFYSTCNQKDSDTQLFRTVPGFVNDIQFFYQQMAGNPALASVPVWVTENNVNADFDSGGGISACNGTAFVRDNRGSSAFFAAWRPYVFSQLGKAGTRALYHWDFGADAQYGEFNDSTGQLQLSYWVDYWLARMFPSPPGADLLEFSSTDNMDLEILPVENANGSVTVMVANYAVANSADNNGPGAPRTVALDLGLLGGFSTGNLLTIDATTNLSSGPTAVSVPPASRTEITLNGYGVAFLTLQ